MGQCEVFSFDSCIRCGISINRLKHNREDVDYMTTLVNRVKTDSVEAMRDRTEAGKAKLSTLRLLVAELEKEKVQHKLSEISGLTDEQAQSVISRQIKKLDAEMDSYIAVGRSTEKQEAEKALLITYLPKQLTEEEIIAEVKHAIELTSKGEIKNPMQYLSKACKGKADMKKVQAFVKELA